MKASNASSAATLVSAIQISCSARLAFGCWLFGNLASTFAVHPAALLARFRPDLTGSFPEQDFGESIVEDSWLNQLDDVIVGHGISLLWWRSGGVKHPHDMPPSRFPPSPTLGDSSAFDDSSHHPLTKVVRIGSSHPCWPPSQPAC